MTAVVEDNMTPANPCQIRGAGVENPQERPVLPAAEVFDRADRMKHPRYRALILLSVFGTLRWGRSVACGDVISHRMGVGSEWRALWLSCEARA
jgi:hypothetical protein